MDSKVYINTFVDNLIQFADLKADAKSDFDESKIKRDKDGKFAKKQGKKDNSKYNDKKGLDNSDNHNKINNNNKEQGINEIE